MAKPYPPNSRAAAPKRWSSWICPTGLETAKSLKKTVDVNVQTFLGNTTDPQFRKMVFDTVIEKHGVPNICVPAAGIARDSIAVRINKETEEPEIYPLETFNQVLNVDLVAPVYWALEMLARIAKERMTKA